jgi:hypothetical protein
MLSKGGKIYKGEEVGREKKLEGTSLVANYPVSNNVV